MSNKYQRGKIYSIRSYQTDDIYIGSTIQFLYMRLAGHRRKYNDWLNEKNNVSNYSSFEIMKYDDAYIELIELCPCNSKMELHRREGQLIREMKCVNKVVAGRTHKEWYMENKKIISQKEKKYRDEHKEYIKEKKHQYYIENKEHINQRNNEWYKNKNVKHTCECGTILNKRGMKRHLKTKKHQTYIQSQSN